MFKSVHDKIWVFDVEWVPDPITGRLVYGLPASMPDEKVMGVMWEKGGATEEDPQPYLKTTLCRIVSISIIIRSTTDSEVRLHLRSLPANLQDAQQSAERNIVGTFLNAVGDHKPQLVGYNSHSADLKILLQRGVANGVQAESFCKRPNKPWEGVDYFANGNERHIDLMQILGGRGKSVPSLHEIASACAIPGKMDMDGEQVAALWLEGKMDRIVEYNEFDVLTTYLLWLRLAHFGGFLTADKYSQEQELLRELIRTESEKPERAHLKAYLQEWERLEALKSQVN
jgi:predicted PolB exonuclease-like 3'-5' exonuclease